MRTLTFAGLIGIAALLAGAAAAQQSAQRPRPDSDEVRALAAGYQLTNADGTLACPITLDPKPAGPGLALVFNRAQCGQRFGFLGEVAAWLPGAAGAIRFVAPGGREIAEFTEGVGGVYEAIRENDGVYFLANLQFVDPSQRIQITDLYGDWNLAAPDGGPVCRLTLSEEVAGDGLLAVHAEPGCDAAVPGFGRAVWLYERGDIVLRSGNGESLRFEHQDGVWTKVPEKPRPLVLSRRQVTE